MSNEEQQQHFVGIREGAAATYLAKSKPSRHSREPDHASGGNPVPLRQLGDVCSVLAGYGFPERLQGRKEGELPFFKVGDISEAWKRGDRLLTRANHYLSQEEAASIRAKPFMPGTVVFAKIGAAIALNRRAILTEPSLVDNNVMGLSPANSQLDGRYLFHFMCTVQLDKLARATTVPSIRKGDVEQIEIPVPPFDEQRRIVAELETQITRLDASVTALKRVQANLKRYRASVLKAACEGRLFPTEKTGWTGCELGNVIRGIEAGRSFKCEERPPQGDEVGIVKVSAVTWGTFDELESKTCLDSARVEQRFAIEQGDFLFSRANTIELIGACVLVHSISRRLMLSDKILRFRFEANVLPSWVLFWLKSDFGKKEIQRLSTGNQESMRNIGQDRIRQIRFRIPPLDEQHRIVAEVERRLSVIEELEATVAANLKRAERLRQSVLARAFS